MLKGDKRKNEIMNTAEYLFCTRGYVETGVQDILDVLHISKGSFYHHFLSKESVLEALCARHSDAAADECAKKIDEIEKPVERFRFLVSKIMPLREEELNFVSMMIPVFDLAEGRMVRLCWQESLQNAFISMVEQEINRLKEAGILLPSSGRVAPICIDLVNRCWGELVSQIVHDGKENRRADLSTLLDILEVHRRALERILDAPYGSIIFCELESLKNLSDRLYRTATM